MAGPEYDFEKIRDVANKWGGEWDRTSGQALQHIKHGRIQHSDFGDNAAAKAFGSLYGEAHQVFEATVEGIQQDLAEFKRKLLLAAQHMHDKDGDAAAALAALAHRWDDDSSFHSHREYQRERDEQAAHRKPEDQPPATTPAGGRGDGQGGGTGDGDPGPQSSADGSGTQIGGQEPPPETDDGDDDTTAYSSSQNPDAGARPDYN